MDDDAEFLTNLFAEETAYQLESFEAQCFTLESERQDRTALDTLARLVHSIKGSSSMIGLDDVAKFTHHFEDWLAPYFAYTRPLSDEDLQVLFDVHAICVKWFSNVTKAADAPPEALELLEFFAGGARKVPAPDATTLVQEDLEDCAEADYLLLSSGEPIEEDLKNKSEPMSKVAASSPTIRIPAARVDTIANLLSELYIEQGKVHNNLFTSSALDKDTVQALRRGERLLKELHAAVIELRMVSLSPLFQKLQRAIREAARETGKSVDVIVEGTDVELDKTVAEAISEPLVHMVRNAVDHGIESAGARAGSDKPEMGTIWLQATQGASTVELTIKDDGRGISTQRVLEKAIANGVIANDAALSEQEVQRLIFHPGLSTASNVTRLSGRGVGMDVVLHAVESLGGDIDIESAQGFGTKFTVTLPTNISMLDVFIIASGGQRFAVPKQDLQEVIDAHEYGLVDSKTLGGKISLRGRVIPFVDLEAVIESRPLTKKYTSRKHYPAFIVTRGATSVAFGFERFMSNEQVVAKPLEQHLEHIKHFSGATVFRDGEPGFILAIHEIFKTYVRESV